MAQSRSVGLNVVIAGDAKGAQRAFRQVKGEVKDVGDSLTRLKDHASSALVAYAGASFLQDSVQSASNLTEALTLSTVVFGESAEAMKKWSESTASSLGIAQSEALQFSANYASLAKSFGVGEDQAVGLAKRLTEHAADLASFRNTSVEDALHAIRSGLTGEMEPMRRFGSTLSVVRLEQQALADGIWDGNGALTLQQKVLATYNLILADTAEAVGDVDRTSGDLATKQKKLSAEWEDAKANLGMGLVPAMRLAVSAATALANAWQAIPGSAQAAMLALGGLALAGPKLVALGKAGAEAFTAFRLGLMGLTEKGAGASNAIGGLIAKMGPAGFGVATAGVVAAGAAFLYLQEQAARTKRNIADLQTQITAGTSPTDAFAQKFANTIAGVEGGFEGIRGSSEDFAKDMEAFGLSAAEAVELAMNPKKLKKWADDFYDALPYNKDGSLKVASVREEEGTRFLGFVSNLEKMSSAATKAKDKADKLEAANKALGLSTDDVAASSETQAEALERVTKALDEHTKRMESRITTARALEQAELDTAQAQQELADLEAAAAGRGKEVAQAREGVADALEREREASEGVRDAQAGLTEAQAGLTAAYAEARDALREKALAAREAEDAEAGAIIAADRARKELERARSQGADELTLREKSQGVREADTNVIDARRKSEEARSEAAKSIEQDEGVVNARKAVADANRGVRDAERQLVDARKATGDAEREVAKVISDAKGKLKEAADKVRDAMLNEAKAAGDASAAQFGAAAGAKEHADRLNDLIALTAPGSQLRQNLEALRQALGAQTAYDQGSLVTSGSMSLAAAESSIRSGPRSLGGLTIVVQGTPQQQRRAVAEATGKELDKVARGGG